MLYALWGRAGHGFQAGAEPSSLDSNLVGKQIYMRWATYGWQLGKINGVITIHQIQTKDTPRLFAKFSHRIMWSDGSKGPASLKVSNYAFGPDARYDSWVLLERM